MRRQISPRHYIGFKACPSHPLLCSSASFPPALPLPCDFSGEAPTAFPSLIVSVGLAFCLAFGKWGVEFRGLIKFKSDWLFGRITSQSMTWSSSGVTPPPSLSSLSLSVFTSLSPPFLPFDYGETHDHTHLNFATLASLSVTVTLIQCVLPLSHGGSVCPTSAQRSPRTLSSPPTGNSTPSKQFHIRLTSDLHFLSLGMNYDRYISVEPESVG